MYFFRKSSKSLSLEKRFKVPALRNSSYSCRPKVFNLKKLIDEFSTNPSTKEIIDNDSFQHQDTSSSLKERYADLMTVANPSKIDQLSDTEEHFKSSNSTQSGRARRRNSITKYSFSEERM